MTEGGGGTTARRVLITGAGGFVGGTLARGFAELGWSVIGVDGSFDAEASDARIRQVSCTLGAEVPDELLSAGAVDLVVHGAWVTTDPDTLGLSEDAYRALNLNPLVGALELARAAGSKAFVFLSSSGVFRAEDSVDGHGLTDEDEPTGRSSYGRLKLEAEERVLRELAHTSTAGHVVRLGYLYGPDERARETRQGLSLVSQWIAAAAEGRSLEVRADDPRREWTFAPDLAAVLTSLVESTPSARVRHVGSPHVYRDSEVAAMIADAVPGAKVVEAPGGLPVKPPMIASDVEAIRGFAWTDAPTGLAQLIGGSVVEAAAP